MLNMTTPTTKPLSRELNDVLHTQSGSDPGTRSIRYLDTASAYDLWSEVYDTDGNFLQALDNIEIESLLPAAISAVHASSSSTSTLTSTDTTRCQGEGEGSIKVVDLGCGTGRNTVKLLDFPVIQEIVAVDLSPKMLEIARQRCLERLNSQSTSSNTRQHQPTLTFSTFDMLASSTSTSTSSQQVSPPLPSPLKSVSVDLIISTLVLEHIPLSTFFSTVSSILAPGGILLLTNMHGDMGKISQAGFVDPKTGDKIRPVSYAHGVAETVGEAEKWGLQVEGVETGWVADGEAEVDGVKEVKMRQDLVGKLGVRSEKWIGVNVWFGGIWRKKGHGEVRDV